MTNKEMDTLKEILFDLTDKHFPKGECKERGNAIVLVGEALIQFKMVLGLNEELESR